MATTLVTVGLLWFSQVPLGVDGEWTWKRHVTPAAVVFAQWSVTVFPAAIIFLGFVICGRNRMRRARSLERAMWIGALVGIAYAWTSIVQTTTPESYRLVTSRWVTYSPAMSGYFLLAREAEDFNQFLATYEARVAEGDVLHIGTHPPGLYAFHKILLETCNRSAAVTGFISRCSNRNSLSAFRTVEASARLRPFLSKSELAALTFAGWLMQLAAALTIVPIYWLARNFAKPGEAWAVAALWPTLPAIAIFLPKSDAMFPLLSMTVLAAWVATLRSGSLRDMLIATLTFWLGLTCSLAMLPVAAVAFVLTCFAFADGEAIQRKRILRSTLSGGFVFAASTAILWLRGINLPMIWSWNYRNHAAFYEHYTRTASDWLPLNLIELAFSVGLPLTLFAVAQVFVGVRTDKGVRRYAIATAGIWMLLWLSGKNCGEAARLWLFLMPWPLPGLAWRGSIGEKHDRIFALLMIAQLLCAVATVSRVAGFEF